jgi:dTDP-4-dehydrorhamnose reductase
MDPLAPGHPVAVVGASGLLGAYVFRSFSASGPTLGTGFLHGGGELATLDMRDEEASRALLAEHAPRTVVCAAAVSNVERCETHPDWSSEINVHGTIALEGPYDETAPTRPLNEYGCQKQEVERKLPALTGGDYMIARVSCLYGHERSGKNFVHQLWSALSEGREFRAPSDQIGTPTAVANAGEVIRELVLRGARGIYHVAGPEPMLRSQFALLAARELDLDPELVRPTPTAELGLVAPRPMGAGLLTGRARAATGRRLWPPREGIREMLAEGPLRTVTSGAV